MVVGSRNNLILLIKFGLKEGLGHAVKTPGQPSIVGCLHRIAQEGYCRRGVVLPSGHPARAHPAVTVADCIFETRIRVSRKRGVRGW